MTATQHIVVVGLGYVGLPLAVALARHNRVTGFDADASRLEELVAGHDRTREVTAQTLSETTLVFTGEPKDLTGADIYIITVPTPVSEDNQPDLGAVRAASRTVGRAIAPGAVVVLESTVYPGVTEEIVGAEVAAASGLTCGIDFHLGYSPERANPGDTEHGLGALTKVVAGQTPEIAARLAEIYGAVTGDNVFVARDIRTAEAAKVIENAQRDINIAFVNEVTMIFNKLGLSVHDVLDAARTKWNFLPFAPGLVGGHCIGVDPYYLAYKAETAGYHPEIILAGRRINDEMGGFLAEAITKQLDGPSRVLLLGLTFKENVPDLRNTRVIDLVAGLTAAGHEVEIHDPLADPGEAKRRYGYDLLATLDGAGPFDGLVAAVAHQDYVDMGDDALAALVTPDGLVADIKGMWRDRVLPESLRRWQL